MNNVSLRQIQNLTENFEWPDFNRVQNFLQSKCLEDVDSFDANKRIIIINGGVAVGKSVVAYNLFKYIDGRRFFFISNDSVYYKMFSSAHSFDVGYDMARRFTNSKLDESMSAGKSFVWETVLSKDTKKLFVEKCLSLGYKFTNINVYTNSLETCYDRSNFRVEQGNHFVSLPFIKDRLAKNAKSMEWLVPLCDTNIFINNSNMPHLEWYRSAGGEYICTSCADWLKRIQKISK